MIKSIPCLILTKAPIKHKEEITNLLSIAKPKCKAFTFDENYGWELGGKYNSKILAFNYGKKSQFNTKEYHNYFVEKIIAELSQYSLDPSLNLIQYEDFYNLMGVNDNWYEIRVDSCAIENVANFYELFEVQDLGDICLIDTKGNPYFLTKHNTDLTVYDSINKIWYDSSESLYVTMLELEIEF